MANTLLKTIGRNSIADGIYRELTSRLTHYYHIFSKTSTWPNELVIPVAIDSMSYERDVRNEMIAMKEISPADIAYVIPRIDWDINGLTVYDNYDDLYSTEIHGLNLVASGSNYSSPTITIGTVCPTNTVVTVGSQYFYVYNNFGYLYTVTTSGTTGSNNVTALGSSTPTINAMYAHGTAILTCVGYQATAAVTLSASRIVSASIVYKGYGYTSVPTVTVTDNSGSNAIINAVMVTGINRGAGIPYTLTECKYYVFNPDNNNIYICVDNNNRSISTIAPTGTSSSVFTTADGYQWKYMSTVPVYSKFLTGDWIPVYTASKNQSNPNGSIVDVKIDSIGTGYATANVTFPTSTTTTVGNKYKYNGYVYTISSTVMSTTTVVPGQKYTIVSLGDTSQSTWNTIAGTSGVTYVVGSVFTCVSVGTGSGTVDAWIPSSISSLSTITNNTTTLLGGVVAICNGPLTAISITGDGTGAALSAQITNGALSGVSVDNVGSNYSYMNIVVSGAGTGATVSASLSSGVQYDSLQASSELSVINNYIVNTLVVSGGSNYTVANVSITGDGTGATATATITNGIITKITLTNSGSNYTWANVSITGDGTGATGRAVLSPYGGLGKDPINNLYAKSLMFYSSIKSNLNQNINVVNDYRQIGIIKDPLRYMDSYYLTSNFASSCWKVTATASISGIVADDIVIAYSNSVQYRYKIDQINGSDILLIALDSGVPVAGMQFTLLNSTISFTITSTTAPAVDKFSGDLIFIDNETAFYNDSTAVRTVLNF